MAPRPLTQRQRLIVLAVTLAGLLVTSLVVEGRLFPPLGSSGLWFYAACLSLLLGDLVLEPWYTRPADALANASAVLLASLTVSRAGLEVSADAFRVGRAACIAYAVAVAALSLVAMLTKRTGGIEQSRLHRYTFVLAGTFGRARVIFGLFFAVAGAAAYARSPADLLALYVAGGLLLWTQPIRLATERFVRIAADHEAVPSALEIRRIAQPRTVFLHGDGGTQASAGHILMRNGQRIGVLVDVSEADEECEAEAALDAGVIVREGERVVLAPDTEPEADLAGAVGKGTSLDHLVVRGSGVRFDELGLAEGSLIEVEVRSQPVLYQVVNAEIESAQPEGLPISKRVRVTARKLGVWNATSGTFDSAEWIPSPGVPAFRTRASRSASVDPSLIGRVPGTDYGASYDPLYGTTHNTAILGILGIGKTTLAIELTWRTLAAGAKVIVIDITNEYAKHFASLFGPEQQQEFEDELNEATAEGRNSRDYQDDKAGNNALFAKVLHERVTEFFEGDQRLLILNPARLVVTRDDGGFPDNTGRAKRIVSLNTAEVTAMIAREILNQVQDEISDELRACLVLEEAHSLAPEWNSTANDGEKQAATATARALMQGRKFGFGSIVVTQRTANVTKSILNQCNTVFALRVYDQTGTEFLGNFIGSDYASLLANLKDRHAIVFGKASSCKSPLLIELNDYDALSDWRARVLDELTAVDPAPSNGDEPSPDSGSKASGESQAASVEDLKPVEPQSPSGGS